MMTVAILVLAISPYLVHFNAFAVNFSVHIIDNKY